MPDADKELQLQDDPPTPDQLAQAVVAPAVPTPPVVVVVDAPTAEAAPLEPPDLGGYRQIGVWAGYPQFKCNDCRQESLDEADMQAHIRSHVPPRPLILGPDGQPLT